MSVDVSKKPATSKANAAAASIGQTVTGDGFSFYGEKIPSLLTESQRLVESRTRKALTISKAPAATAAIPAPVPVAKSILDVDLYGEGSVQNKAPPPPPPAAKTANLAFYKPKPIPVDQSLRMPVAPNQLLGSKIPKSQVMLITEEDRQTYESLEKLRKEEAARQAALERDQRERSRGSMASIFSSSSSSSSSLNTAPMGSVMRYIERTLGATGNEAEFDARLNGARDFVQEQMEKKKLHLLPSGHLTKKRSAQEWEQFTEEDGSTAPPAPAAVRRKKFDFASLSKEDKDALVREKYGKLLDAWDTVRHKCVRCAQDFLETDNFGQYECMYHWGVIKRDEVGYLRFTCCNQPCERIHFVGESGRERTIVGCTPCDHSVENFLQRCSFITRIPVVCIPYFRKPPKQESWKNLRKQGEGRELESTVDIVRAKAHSTTPGGEHFFANDGLTMSTMKTNYQTM